MRTSGSRRATAPSARTALHRLSDGAVPRDRAQPATHRPRPATVAHAAVHVAEDPAGQRDIEELRAVVGSHCRPERYGDAEPLRDQAPPPGATQGRAGRHHERGQQRLRAREPQPVHERAGSLPPHEGGQDRGAAQEARPDPDVLLMAAPIGRWCDWDTGGKVRWFNRRCVSRRAPPPHVGRCLSRCQVSRVVRPPTSGATPGGPRSPSQCSRMLGQGLRVVEAGTGVRDASRRAPSRLPRAGLRRPS